MMIGKIENDGSISVLHNGLVLLEKMYPGVDYHPIHTLNMEQSETDIIWHLTEGDVICHVVPCSDKSFELQIRLKYWKKKIHTFFPVYQSELMPEGFYQAAEGMGRDTGYYSVDELLERRNTASYGLCSVKYPSCALTIYSLNQVWKDINGIENDGYHYETVFEMDAYERERYTDGWSKNHGDATIRLSCGIRIEATNGDEIQFAPLKFLLTDTVEEGLEKAAGEIGENLNARLHMPPAFHWCSWYYCYHNFDMQQLEEYLYGLIHLRERIPLRYIQIDAGYFPSAGDWLLPNDRFPDGLEKAFEKIKQAGYQPGIWIGPYMVGNRSRLYKEHPDWILYDLEGKPVRPWITDNEPKPWGYQDEEYYVLDTSHPDAMEYMKRVFTTLHKMGAVMFKTDFMLWGFQDSSRVRRYTPGRTSVEYFRDFLKVIREAIGDESYWLGCIAPFLPFVGFADGMRIGGDVGSSWDGEFGPQNMINSLVGNNYTNHNYYQTDPDAMLLRDFHIQLNTREIYSLALLAALSGSCIYTSDPLHLLSEERIRLLRFLTPDSVRHKAYIPLLTKKGSAVVLVCKKGKRGFVYILNKSDSIRKDIISLEELGFSDDWNVYSFRTGERETLWNHNIITELEPHGCRLFLLTLQHDITIDYSNLWNNLN